MNDMILSSISIEELEKRITSRIISELQQSKNSRELQPAVEEEFITVKKAADLIGVSKVTVHKWKKAGKLKAYYFNTRVRFKKTEILKYFEAIKIQAK